jgi:NADH-quinone oxidoreductase subunit E
MSVRRLAVEQPEDFAFSPKDLEWAKGQIAKYPDGRQASAVLPLLWRAQEQCGGWLPEPALRYVADLLGMAYIRVYEIATFYTMFNLAPVGRYYVQLCGTTPCWLRGAEALKETCRKVIGAPGHVTPDGMFSWTEVECLGACVNAPMVQINKDYYEDLTPETFEQILVDLRQGRKVKPGPQDGRHSSEPFGGATTLIDPKLYPQDSSTELDPEDVEFALADNEAKKPGAAASRRETPAPKPPLRDSSGKRRK